MNYITEIQKGLIEKQLKIILEELNDRSIRKSNEAKKGDLRENSEYLSNNEKIDNLKSQASFLQNILNTCNVKYGIPRSNKVDLCSVIGIQKIDDNNNPIEDLVYYQISSIGNFRFKILSTDSIIVKHIFQNPAGIYSIPNRLGIVQKYNVVIVDNNDQEYIEKLLDISIDKLSPFNYVNNRLQEWKEEKNGKEV